MDAALPSYNQFTSSPSVAAGVPVLELVRKFEDEKILTREDRIALNEALNDEGRRDGIVKALRDLELGDGSRFAVRRLKALIHQNGLGEMSSRTYKEQQERLKSLALMQEQGGSDSASAATAASVDAAASRLSIEVPDDQQQQQQQQQSTPSAAASSPSSRSGAASLRSPKGSSSPSRARTQRAHAHSQGGQDGDDNRSLVSLSSQYDTQSAIVEVVGASPVYSDPDSFNICSKIGRRLRDFLVRMKMAPSQGQRRFAVVVGEGSCNPLTRMHLRAYFVAKQYLEGKAGFIVLGSLLSPAHGMTVRERYRTHPSEIIPAPHRLAVAQLMVQESKWISVDPWEITRRRPLDYLSLLQHTRETLLEQFPGVDIKVIYLCKANAVPLLSPSSLRAEGFGVVVPCRALEYDQLKASLSAKWNGVIWCVEDTAVLDASMDVVTSRRVRDKVRSYASVETLVGTAIDQYFRQHAVGAKMNGAEEWSEEEKKLPAVASRPFAFSLKSQQLQLQRGGGVSGLAGAGAGPLTGVNTPATAGPGGYTPSWQNQGQGLGLGSVPSSAAPAPASVADASAAPASLADAPAPASSGSSEDRL